MIEKDERIDKDWALLDKEIKALQKQDKIDKEALKSLASMAYDMGYSTGMTARKPRAF